MSLREINSLCVPPIALHTILLNSLRQTCQLLRMIKVTNVQLHLLVVSLYAVVTDITYYVHINPSCERLNTTVFICIVDVVVTVMPSVCFCLTVGVLH